MNNSKPNEQEALPNVFEYLKGTIPDLVSIAKQKRNDLVKLTLSKPTERQLADLQSLGIDIDDKYVHTIDNFSIIHTFKQHGNAKTEASRGQIALADADFNRIPRIIEDYDGIGLDKNDRSQDVIIYSKTFEDGVTYYLEEVRVGRKELSMVTMYKRKLTGEPMPKNCLRF